MNKGSNDASLRLESTPTGMSACDLAVIVEGSMAQNSLARLIISSISISRMDTILS